MGGNGSAAEHARLRHGTELPLHPAARHPGSTLRDTGEPARGFLGR